MRPKTLTHKTVQKFSEESKNCITQQTDTHTQSTSPCSSDTRNHYPQIKHHTPPPKDGATTKPHPLKKGTPPPVSHTRDEEIAGLLPQSPIVCLMISSPAFDHSKPEPAHSLLCTRTTPTTGMIHPTIRPAHRTPTQCGRVWVSWCSLERR
jgi:hypothetical protein